PRAAVDEVAHEEDLATGASVGSLLAPVAEGFQKLDERTDVAVDVADQVGHVGGSAGRGSAGRRSGLSVSRQQRPIAARATWARRSLRGMTWDFFAWSVFRVAPQAA